MNYPDAYEYPNIVMDAMENALMRFFGNSFKSVEFYKANDTKNYIGKIDGTTYLVLNNDYELNLQIKRSDKYKNTFTVDVNAMNAYLSNNYNIQALLIGTAWDRNMHIVYWKPFLELAGENLDKWLAKNGGYYIIPLKDLRVLHMRDIPYFDEDYEKLEQYWREKQR